MDRSHVRTESESRGAARPRRVLVASLLAVVVALVAAWWWLARAANGPTRAADASHSEVARVQRAVELAASPASSAVRTEALEQAAIEVVAPEPASPTVVSQPHLVVTRAKEPLVGARVELWNEPLEGEAETHVFTSDSEGRVVLPDGLAPRGPWFALAGGAGACSIALEPHAVNPSADSTELRCVDMQHVAVLFERSDGAPIGGWDGVYASRVTEFVGQRRYFEGLGPDERIRRALLAAGLDPATDLETKAHVAVGWDTDFTNTDSIVTGKFSEPDTEEVEWLVHMHPLARGGALERVAIPVRDDVACGWIEVRLHGESVVGALDAFPWITVPLVLRGASDTRILTLVVRDPLTPMAAARTLFRVPAGTCRAHLSLGGQLTSAEPLEFEVLPNQTVAAEFELPASGAIVLAAPSESLLREAGPWIALKAFDVATDVERIHESPQKSATVAVVDPGRLIVRVAAPLRGFLVPIGTGERLAADPAIHAELLGHPSRRKNRSDPPQLSAAAETYLVDVRAGGESVVEFVPDPVLEEKR